MVKQYGQILVCVKSGETIISFGVPVTTQGPTIQYECRYRPNTSARTVQGIDGKTVIYRGTCYVPKPDTEIKMGDKVSVPGFIDEAIVLQVHNAQMRTRIIL